MAAPTPTFDRAETVIPRWGLGDAVVGWVVAYGSALLFSAVVVALAGYEPGDDLPLTVIALTYPPLWLGFVGIPIWAAAIKGNGWVQDFRAQVTARDVPVGLAIGIAAQLVLVPLISLPVLYLTDTSTDDLSRPAQELADKAGGPLSAFLFVLIVGLCAPIAEEIFFRGLVFRSFEKQRGRGAGWALAMSSIMFGLTHFQLLQLPALIAAGAVFGYVMMRTGRLGTAVFAHMGFNLTTVVVLLWVQ